MSANSLIRPAPSPSEAASAPALPLAVVIDDDITLTPTSSTTRTVYAVAVADELITITLGPCSPALVGAVFEFIITSRAGGNVTIACNEADSFVGGFVAQDVGQAIAVQNADDTFTLIALGAPHIGSRLILEQFPGSRWGVQGAVITENASGFGNP